MPAPISLFDALLETARLRRERDTLRNRITKLEHSRDQWRERARNAERAKLPKRLR